MAGDISDDPLRAHTLWAISAERRRAGDEAGARGTEALARQATKEIKSALSRVWMFGDLALGHLAAGEKDAAWKAFAEGLSLAREIHNAWARARVLGKLATTLAELTRPGAFTK